MSSFKKTIGLSRKQREALSFLKESLNNNHISFFYSINKHRVVFELYEDCPKISDILTETVLIFNKFDEINKLLSSTSLKNMSYYAYFGAVLSLDCENEKHIISKKLEALDDINLDGFYNFCLADMQESWKNLAVLSQRLYRQCTDDDEVYDLIAFMLGVDGLTNSDFVLDNSKGIELFCDEKKIPIFPLFHDEEKNVISTILYYHPKNITVQYPSRLSPEILSTIQRLGE